MGLTKRSASNTIYLEAKHFSIWQQLKEREPGCETLQVSNPKTKEVVTKHGYKFDSLTGFVDKIEKYDTEKKYTTRYFGFKLHMSDGDARLVLDMPYNGGLLRRFLRLMPNFDWTKTIKLTVFKGRKKDSDIETTAFWFQQDGLTVKAFYTKDEPHGMPPATYDDQLQQWDFKAQHRWLVDRLKEAVAPEVERIAAERTPAEASRDEDDDGGLVSKPRGPVARDEHEPDEPPPFADITDDDVPF